MGSALTTSTSKERLRVTNWSNCIYWGTALSSLSLYSQASCLPEASLVLGELLTGVSQLSSLHQHWDTGIKLLLPISIMSTGYLDSTEMKWLMAGFRLRGWLWTLQLLFPKHFWAQVVKFSGKYCLCWCCINTSWCFFLARVEAKDPTIIRKVHLVHFIYIDKVHIKVFKTLSSI